MNQAVTAPTSEGNDDDRTLVAQAAAGDRGAARTLYDRHSARVHRLAYRMCGDMELANDLTQDVFVQAFRQLGTFRGESAFTTWLHRVAVTTVLNAMRKVKRLRLREAELDDAKDHANPEDPVDPETREALAQAIEALPEGLRIALVMHSLEGYTHVEIGAALGIAELHHVDIHPESRHTTGVLAADATVVVQAGSRSEWPIRLHIYRNESGIFLDRIAADGRVLGDTWHQSVAEAKQQALEEFEASVGVWRRVPSSTSDRDV